MLLGGNVYAPVSLDNPYGGFYFYSSHLIEIALRHQRRLPQPRG